MANRGVYIKSPFDIILGGLRSFNVNCNVSDASNYEAQYEIWKTFNYATYEMDQAMGKIPSVAGWQAYYQKPSFHEYWINSNSIQRRFGLVAYLLFGFDKTDNSLTTRLEIDVVGFVQQFPNSIIQDPNLLVNECIKYLLPVDLSTTAKNNIKSEALLGGQTSDYYWTGAWNDYLANPNAINLSVVKPRLQSLMFAIIQLAEFQLM